MASSSRKKKAAAKPAKAAPPKPKAKPPARPAKKSAAPLPKKPAAPAPKRSAPTGKKPAAKPAPVIEEPTMAPRRLDARRHVLSLAFLRDGDEFMARLETDSGQITELKNRSLDQLLTLVASELEDILE